MLFSGTTPMPYLAKYWKIRPEHTLDRDAGEAALRSPWASPGSRDVRGERSTWTSVTLRHCCLGVIRDRPARFRQQRSTDPPGEGRSQPGSPTRSLSDYGLTGKASIPVLAGSFALCPSMSSPDPTPEDVALVASRCQECASQFNLADLAASMLRFYNLLITMGHWPLNSLHIGPHPSLDTAFVDRLQLSPPALAAIQTLPYPSENVIYNRLRRIFPRSRLLDLTDPEDLECTRYPIPNFDLPGLPQHIISLMNPSRDGSIVLLDTELGALWHYDDNVMEGPWRDTPEYRVARKGNGVPVKDQGWEPDLELRICQYLPFTSAKRWFDAQYEEWYTLQRLPLLDPDHAGDPDLTRETSGMPGDFGIDLIERQRIAIVGLMKQHGWPPKDEPGWNREEFLHDWAALEDAFRKEDLEKLRREAAAQGEFYE